MTTRQEPRVQTRRLTVHMLQNVLEISGERGVLTISYFCHVVYFQNLKMQDWKNVKYGRNSTVRSYSYSVLMRPGDIGVGQGHKLWEVVNEDPIRCGTLIAACAGLVALLAGLLEPFLPATSIRIAAQLGLQPSDVALRQIEGLASQPHRILPTGEA
jgi:uncharacterized protein YjeT (DUF2065 family)